MITGKAIMKFGKGDILVTPLLDESLEKGILVFQDNGTGVIGEYTPSEMFEKEDTETIMAFSNIESLDVVIERLSALREMMNGNIEGCTSSDISYKEELDGE